MAEEVRLTEVRQEIFDPSRLEYDKERYAGHNTRFAELITAPHADTGQTFETVATITVTTGKILNIMRLRFAAYDASGVPVSEAYLEIMQANAPVDADPNSGAVLFGLADGVIDVVYPGYYAGTLENPLAKVQGTVTFRILSVVEAYNYAVMMMGDEYSPEPVEHYENLVAES